MVKKISKKMTFAELLEARPDAAEKLVEKGMFCCGCPMAMMENLEQGCQAHGIDVDELIKDLDKKDVKKKKARKK